ncbi:DUF3011 domain-containing protein [Ahniella affigens]|nr:DUF3011 domain-containing protein [Ahniella affigens]
MKVVGLLVGVVSAVLVAYAPKSQAYHDNGGYIVRCESIDYRDNYCPIDTGGGVYVERNLGRTACIEGDNWGYDRNGIWVSEGCRADFAVPQGYSNGRGWQYGPGRGQPYRDQGDRRYGRGQRVICESYKGRYNYCGVGSVRNAELVYQMSNSSCVYRQSWGFDRGGVWVSRGCRAEFLVY